LSLSERWTVLKILRWTTSFFEGKGIETGRLDAELLLADTLGLDRVGVYVNFDRPLTEDELTAYRRKVRRRSDHEPVQYILGETEFWSLPLHVCPDVLIPRPDTEILVEEVLRRIDGPADVIDVGTGSGAVAIAVAHEKPTLKITAIDCSRQALSVARGNAERHGMTDRIIFQEADLSTLPPGPYDLIVSNPPYISATEWDTLMPEVRDYEPRLALFGGDDGLTAYRHLSGQAPNHLKPGGWLLVEIGAKQAPAVRSLFDRAGLSEVGVRNDYAGLPRVVYGRVGVKEG
jgi:release factor glutamine methyltransferase